MHSNTSAQRSVLFKQISEGMKHIQSLMDKVSESYMPTPPKKFSTNGALAYALKHNKMCMYELVSLGEHQAKKLKWVGQMVWDEAHYLVNQPTHLRRFK